MLETEAGIIHIAANASSSKHFDSLRRTPTEIDSSFPSAIIPAVKPWRITTLLLLLLLCADAFGITCAPKNASTGFFGVSVSRARYYKPDTGRFWTMDSFEGSQSDPLSLHKYLYAANNPVNMVDPSGHDGNMPSLTVTMTIGAAIGATSAYYANHALGRAQTFSSIFMGAAVGAFAGPMAVEYAWFGVGLGAVSVASSGTIVWEVFKNPNSTYFQRVEASALLVASVWGSQVATKYAYAAKMKPVENLSTQAATKRLFRFVGKNEAQSLRETGEFSVPESGGSTPDGKPGRWFYGTRADAEAFAAAHLKEGGTIVATEVTESSIAVIAPGIDGNRTGYFVHLEDLGNQIHWLPYP